MDLVLDKLQRLICHKTQPTNQPTNHQTYFHMTSCDILIVDLFSDRFHISRKYEEKGISVDNASSNKKKTVQEILLEQRITFYLSLLVVIVHSVTFLIPTSADLSSLFLSFLSYSWFHNYKICLTQEA